MKKIIAGNWKMYGEPGMAQALATAVAHHSDTLPDVVSVVLCPPAVLLAEVSGHVAGARATRTGGQSCHAKPEGAFTGDISAPMLKAAGAEYVIVGHSERRQYHHETSADVRAMAEAGLKAGLCPIICIGESLQERQNGQALDMVGRQVVESLPQGADMHDFVLAYEPVWAIGSGLVPTLDDIAAMHAHILAVAAKQTGKQAGAVAVLYGGSVKGDNAQAILAVPGVSGVLVGGASLKAEEFCRIISAAV
ncbi:MAG: triose-phosphate isomerase [Rickettsiales bacterium]|nr:triose-phosphate isomerase [Rickettsiales bacterium]